jgi:hypothetical protein
LLVVGADHGFLLVLVAAALMPAGARGAALEPGAERVGPCPSPGYALRSPR